MRYCNLIVIFISLSVLASTHLAANAYVLQGPHILDIMTKRLGKATSLLVSQNLILHDSNPVQSAARVGETLRYIFPATCRSDIVSEDFQKIHVLAEDESLTVIDEKVVDGYENRYDRYKDLLLFRSRTLLQGKLPAVGVNVSISSIGRFQGKLAYIIGAQYPDETVPQIWVNKETFRPFRWIITGHAKTGAQDSLEVRYLEWREVESTWYPMRIEFFRNHVLYREILVQNIR
ncbi:MAG: hypothetical protein JSV38_09190, partial [Desulfobacterales bacterium]